MTRGFPVRIAGIIVMIICMTGCSREPLLADGPLEITQQPTVVRLPQSCAPRRSEWRLCFEFDPPGDSHHAAAIQVVLIAESGERVPLMDPAIDRVGEAAVCQIAALVPPHAGQSAFRGVELSSVPPVRVRAIRGGNCL